MLDATCWTPGVTPFDGDSSRGTVPIPAHRSR